MHDNILIASMDVSTSLLNSIFGMHEVKSDKIFERIEIAEIDSQYLKIEVDGSSFDSVKEKINEIIKHLKVLHDGRLDEVRSKKKRELQYIEEKLLTIDKFINTITKDNNIYISDVAELKLKEIEYTHILKELKRHLGNMHEFRHTGLIKEIQLSTYSQGDNTRRHTLTSFIIGFILSSLFALIRHGLIKSFKE